MEITNKLLYESIFENDILVICLTDLNNEFQQNLYNIILKNYTFIRIFFSPN